MSDENGFPEYDRALHKFQADVERNSQAHNEFVNA